MEQLKHFRRRLGSADRGKNNYDINPSEPTFSVRYIGMSCVTEDFEPAVNGHILAAQHIRRLQQDCKAGKTVRKVDLSVSANSERGLTISDVLTKGDFSFQLHDIAYCCTNKEDPKIFSLIVERDGQLQCHGFITSNAAKTRAVCLAISNAFATAYDISLKKNKKLESKKVKTGRESSHEGKDDGTNEVDSPNTLKAESAEHGENDVIFYRGFALPTSDVFDLDNNPEVPELSKVAREEVANEEVENGSE